MYTAKTSSKGQIVIPKEYRDKLGIKAGDRVGISVVADRVEIYALPDDPVEAYCGIFSDGPSLVDALMKSRKEDQEHEERRSGS
ncbi:MAG: AbrB/MazE/SpoVT family DNA-binding domain-containing protein [Actinobacteria bacterium]|nr:AbrB/MazE/SpoVT family DNA-binding domain-containing protein [Actinomycetota bacterium]MCL5882893.1 AbrB/MazE/SpoVT family DNA-binding domain-containing protein [Actinomycetota bacterium]